MYAFWRVDVYNWLEGGTTFSEYRARLSPFNKLQNILSAAFHCQILVYSPSTSNPIQYSFIKKRTQVKQTHELT